MTNYTLLKLVIAMLKQLIELLEKILDAENDKPTPAKKS